MIKCLFQEIAFFDDQKHNTGALTARLAMDASAIQGVSNSDPDVFPVVEFG